MRSPSPKQEAQSLACLSRVTLAAAISAQTNPRKCSVETVCRSTFQARNELQALLQQGSGLRDQKWQKAETKARSRAEVSLTTVPTLHNNFGENP